MGRLHNFFHGKWKSRGARGSEGRAIARRRKLAFEQCESRIALSATQAAAVTYDGAFLSNLWQATPGASDWPAVTFAPIDGGASGFQEASFRIIDATDFAAKSSLRAESHLAEGGFITLGLNRGATLQSTGAASQIVGYAFSDLSSANAANSVQFSGRVSTNGEIVTDHFHILQPNLGASDSNVLVGSGSTYADAIGVTGESYFDAANVTGLSLNVAPVLRITIPAGRGNSEGGAIDLTAMAGPTKALGSQWSNNVALAEARAWKVSPSLASTSAPAREAMPIEGLRARAVVYEVADARELGAVGRTLDEVPAADGGDAEHGPRTEDHSSQSGGAPLRRAPHAAANAAAARPAAVDGSVTAETPYNVSADETATRGHSAANAEAAARDAALAGWSDAADRSADGGANLTARDADAAGLTFAASRRQKAGLAFALVVGAGPLVRRARRARSRPEAEQPSLRR